MSKTTSLNIAVNRQFRVPSVPNYLMPEDINYNEDVDSLKIHVSYLTEEQAQQVIKAWGEAFLDKVRGNK